MKREKKQAGQSPQRVLVIMPASLSDCVMATPTLDAIRGLYPKAKITAVIRRRNRGVLEGLGSVDRIISHRKKKKKNKTNRRRTLVGLGRRLAKAEFDMTVILPDSFKAAALAAMSGIPRRVGYERDGRGVLLTDRLIPRKHKGEFVPVPRLDYYLGIARYLGAVDPSHAMRLAVDDDSTARVTRWLAAEGCNTQDCETLMIAPGGRDPRRRWSTRRYAHLIDLMHERFGTMAVIVASAQEREVAADIMANTKSPAIDLSQHDIGLSEIKSVLSLARLVVTNDTGPRHIAAALGRPTLALFGPSGPEWSHTGVSHEQHLVSTGLSIAARDDPGFDGQASIDRIRTDTAFEAATQLYRRTADALGAQKGGVT